MPVPGQQPDADRQGIASGHQPIAIVLDFVNPVRPGWRLLARRWQAGFDNGRQRHDIMAYGSWSRQLSLYSLAIYKTDKLAKLPIIQPPASRQCSSRPCELNPTW